MEALGTPAAT